MDSPWHEHTQQDTDTRTEKKREKQNVCVYTK